MLGQSLGLIRLTTFRRGTPRLFRNFATTLETLPHIPHDIEIPKPVQQEPPLIPSSLQSKIIKVDTPQVAEKILKILQANRNAVWACDTEVMNIDVKSQGPVGNGKVTCVSIYGGPDVDFLQFGKGYAIWIENIGQANGLLKEYFQEWFEDENYEKIWHNYGFDRHVMMNEGIDCKGFAGDTMHMARLWDTSRDKGRHDS